MNVKIIADCVCYLVILFVGGGVVGDGGGGGGGGGGVVVGWWLRPVLGFSLSQAEQLLLAL